MEWGGVAVQKHFHQDDESRQEGGRVEGCERKAGVYAHIYMQCISRMYT